MTALDYGFGDDGLLRYRYRGTNPAHHENTGLRLAMQRQVPLVYFHGTSCRTSTPLENRRYRMASRCAISTTLRSIAT